MSLKGTVLQLFFIIPIVLALVSYLCYSPIPDDIDQPWKMRLFLGTAKFGAYLGNSMTFFGFGTPINVTRLILRKTAVKETDRSLQISEKIFNGVKVRVYQPFDRSFTGKRPGLVFYHGGGWMYMDVDTHDHITRKLAKELNAVVVSVDYRRAPEFPFPTPLFDCELATRFFLSHASHFRVDPRRIGIIGDSAGGNLAAGVALKLNEDVNATKPNLQVLIYPMLQGIDFSLPSHVVNSKYMPELNSIELTAEEFLGYMGITDKSVRDAMTSNNHLSSILKRNYRKFIDYKLLDEKLIHADYKPVDLDGGDARISSRLEPFIMNPLFTPIIATNLAGLPKTHVIVAGYDVLRDEALIYVERLKQAKVPVSLEYYEKGFHGMLSQIGDFEISDKCMSDLIAYLKQNL
ncbi:neutral cholesterol ester hydrolase 1-like [Tubulanus polymorphus]|uniref:neutral cholesterol ester hydrolase 1-like n=1 Tax=Tubulanus polymorphus TaxID=672921 RepID=UPI003DA2BB97